MTDDVSSLSVTPTIVAPAVAPTQSLADRPPWEGPKCEAKGKRQRLRLYVPTASTTMSLGDTDARNGQYNGFGVHTSGHVVFSAIGTEGSGSRMRFESQGNMVLQSTDGSLFMGSKCVTTVVAGEQLYLGGAKGVLVHGGSLSEAACPMADSRTGKVPDAAKAWYYVKKDYASVKSNWEFADAAVCLMEAGIGVHKMGLDKLRELPIAVKSLKLISPLLSSIWGVGAGIFGGAVGYTGTIVHGSSGILVGSPGFTSFYGGLSTTFASVGGVFMAANWIEVYGRKKAEIVSKFDVTVSSRNVLEVLGKKELVVASFHDRAVLDGKALSIGGRGTSKTQTDTASVAFGVDEAAILQGKDVILAGKKVAAVAGEDVSLCATKNTTVASTKHVALGVERSQIVVQKDRVAFGMFADGLAAVPKRESPPPKTDHHHFAHEAGECIGKRAEAAGSWASDYRPPTPKGVVVWLTKSEIRVTCKSYDFFGGSFGWKFPKMQVLK